MTRCCRCWTPAGAEPRAGGCGATRSTTGPGAGAPRRRWSTSTPRTARASTRRPTWPGSGASCRWTATAGGPPPEEWRGGIRTSRGRAHVDPFHAGPRLGRGAVAQGRVQTLPVVEDLDILEHRRRRTGAEADVVDVLLLERGEEALHRRVVQAVAAPA